KPRRGYVTGPRGRSGGRRAGERPQLLSTTCVPRRRKRNDLRLARGDPQHPRPTPADHHRWVRPLRRARKHGRVGDAVKGATVGDLPLYPETFVQRERLFHSIETELWRV